MFLPVLSRRPPRTVLKCSLYESNQGGVVPTGGQLSIPLSVRARHPSTRGSRQQAARVSLGSAQPHLPQPDSATTPLSVASLARGAARSRLRRQCEARAHRGKPFFFFFPDKNAGLLPSLCHGPPSLSSGSFPVPRARLKATAPKRGGNLGPVPSRGAPKRGKGNGDGFTSTSFSLPQNHFRRYDRTSRRQRSAAACLPCRAVTLLADIARAPGTPTPRSVPFSARSGVPGTAHRAPIRDPFLGSGQTEPSGPLQPHRTGTGQVAGSVPAPPREPSG